MVKQKGLEQNLKNMKRDENQYGLPSHGRNKSKWFLARLHHLQRPIEMHLVHNVLRKKNKSSAWRVLCVHKIE